MTQKTMSVLLATAFLVGVGYRRCATYFQKADNQYTNT